MAKSIHLGIWDQVRAGLLLEAELRERYQGKIPVEYVQPAIRALWDLPILTRLSYARSWLSNSDANRSDAISLSNAVVQHVRNIRDQDLAALNHRREFIAEARKTWLEIQRVLLSRVETTERSGDHASARRYELQLLTWAEQFENRLLLEEIRSSPQPATGANETLSMGQSWRPGDWGFDEPWGPQELDGLDERSVANWFEERNQRLQRLYPDELRTTPTVLASCVSERPVQDKISDLNREMTVADVPSELLEVDNYSMDLAALVPESAIWIRSLFEIDGSLRWWAWVKQNGDFTRVASGCSQPGARQRLERANLAFDLTVEQVWNAFASTRIKDHLIVGFVSALNRMLTKGAPDFKSRSDMFDFFSLAAECLSRLTDRHPGIAMLASKLVATLRKGKDLHSSEMRWLQQQWHASLAAVDDPWPEPPNSMARETRRRRELNEASQKHLSALLNDFDLSPLFDSEGADCCGADVMLQVQGPLHAMPLAWLNYRGRPLFEVAASVSTSVSMTLWKHIALRVDETKPQSDDLLSVFWEHPDARATSHGLQLLHAGLRKLVGKNRYWTLGDKPRASAANLSVALREKMFGLVVIGAHGSVQASGVKLADDDCHWCGNGTDLSAVDLLVLVSCAVGRMSQGENRDVEGMYARLAVQGARCVVAARWPIADTEAACFILEMVNEYLTLCQKKGGVGRFDRARALNHARRAMLNHPSDVLRVSMHQAAAFDIYGLC